MFIIEGTMLIELREFNWLPLYLPSPFEDVSRQVEPLCRVECRLHHLEPEVRALGISYSLLDQSISYRSFWGALDSKVKIPPVIGGLIESFLLINN